VLVSSCRHRHGGVASSSAPATSSSAEPQAVESSEEKKVTEVASTAITPAAPKDPPPRTNDDVKRIAPEAGAPTAIAIPKAGLGTYAGHKHRSGKERLEGETCTITADKQLSLTILEDGKASWSGLTFLDLRCPGDEKDKPAPSTCWYEGQGV